MEDQRARFSTSRQLMNHEWSQLCSMGKITLYVHLRKRQKWLPTGTASHPQKDDPSFRFKESKNNMVISKLRSIIDNKQHNYSFFATLLWNLDCSEGDMWISELNLITKQKDILFGLFLSSLFFHYLDKVHIIPPSIKECYHLSSHSPLYLRNTPF